MRLYSTSPIWKLILSQNSYLFIGNVRLYSGGYLFKNIKDIKKHCFIFQEKFPGKKASSVKGYVTVTLYEQTRLNASNNQSQ